MGDERAAARQIIERALAARVFPAAVVDVGTAERSLWCEAFGSLTFEGGAPRAALDTLFDLASLTKVIATTTAFMELVRLGRVRLDDPVSAYFEEWRGLDREVATLQDLLEHASGLGPRLGGPPPHGRPAFVGEICRTALAYPPRARSVYSDLDFILLGFLAADRGNAPLDELVHGVLRGAGIGRSALTYAVSQAARPSVAPTSPLPLDPRLGRVLQGEVHDDYAAALDGVAGHAGLFGTAAGVGVFARLMLRAARGGPGCPPPFSPELVQRFTTKSGVPGSSRALGWDTMLRTSSCGSGMSPRAFGQVGFTGTSLWIDPERDRYFVLLTNRAYGDGSLDDIRAVRRGFHDALRDF